jgi:hypothetical protein
MERRDSSMSLKVKLKCTFATNIRSHVPGVDHWNMLVVVALVLSSEEGCLAGILGSSTPRSQGALLASYYL